MTKSAISQDLSPAEIKNKDFKKTMLGYSPEEVVGFLDSVAKLWEKIQKRERDLLETIERLESTIRAWESRESELEGIRKMAQKEADRIVSIANQKAEEMFQESEVRAQTIRKDTEAWLAEVLEEVEEVQRRKSNFINAFQTALDSHYEILKSEKENRESLSCRLTEYLKNQRTGKGLNCSL